MSYEALGLLPQICIFYAYLQSHPFLLQKVTLVSSEWILTPLVLVYIPMKKLRHDIPFLLLESTVHRSVSPS